MAMFYCQSCQQYRSPELLSPVRHHGKRTCIHCIKRISNVRQPTEAEEVSYMKKGARRAKEYLKGKLPWFAKY